MASQHRKILVLSESFPSYSETFVLDHILGLHRLGWAVTVATFAINHEWLDRIGGLPVGIDLIECRPIANALRKNWLIRNLFVASRLLRTHPMLFGNRLARVAELQSLSFTPVALDVNPSVIHVHFGNIALCAAHAANKLGVPLIANFHGIDATEIPQRYGWKPYLSYLGRHISVCHSSFIEHRLSVSGLRHIRRITLGVDLSIFRPLVREDASWGRPLRLMTLGRLEEKKGHQDAIAALKLLHELKPEYNARLMIIGEGLYREKLMTQAVSLGIKDAVDFYGVIPYSQIGQYLEQADILVVPSIRSANGSEEAFCRVALEGMAAGVPVIATRSGGLPDTIGEAGVLVEQKDPGALAGAVVHLVDRTKRSLWVKKGLVRAQQLSLDRMWADYNSLSLDASCSNAVS